MTPVTIRDHVRPTDGGYPDGIYRVVGTSNGTATLLRVGDADGRRITTGEVVRVAENELEAFAPAENPDGNRPLGAPVASTVEMGYWSLRAFGQQLATRPLPAVVAGVLVVIGAVGEGVVPVPTVVLTVSVITGSIALALVGSGRM
ncbi:hypothetical protein [Natrinema sp. 74]|uniref:hypothetical protein n=1 Tax=Natrinema sp. 74 TaxID=3384159 RepID=UPI0038D4404C